MNSPTRRFGVLVSLLTVLSLTGSASALAQEQIKDFTVEPSTTQAGAHPDIHAGFSLESPGEPESAREITVAMPRGFFGNPNAIPKCTSTDFALDQCQSVAQAGLVTLTANYSGNSDFILGTAPVYDMQTSGDSEAARYAFNVPTLDIPISIPVSVRTGSDFGLDFRVSGITQLAPLASASLTFWGYPADPTHDAEHFPKGSPGSPAGCPGSLTATCIGNPALSNIVPKPMTENPTVCDSQAPPVSIELRTYQDPQNPSRATASYPAIGGCEHQAFKPSLQADVTTHTADSPSGLDLTFDAKQALDAEVTASEVRQVTVTLPDGLTINPDAADGQRACADAEADFGTDAPAQCPDNAKIGTFELNTPALDGPLLGSVYFGAPEPGNQYRLFLIADGFGIHAKLQGTFRPDPSTGQVRALFEDLPQVPFERIAVHLFASDRGLLATPTHCTLYPIEADFAPWNATLADQTSTQFFSVREGPNGASCPGQTRPFHPRLVAGTSTPLAGAFSAFTLKLDRDDGDQFLGDLNFRMPPGFTGSLRGISYCPEAAILAAAANSGLAEQASPSCPASSQIGTTNVAAGPGSHPFHAVGRMFLSGPFHGAPLSLAAITPALAGPYDYGVVVVRVALRVDPRTAQVSAVSDRVPQIIGGVPIRMRSIQVNIDRPEFTINPTNCTPSSIDSQGIGDQGTITNFSSYFHAVNCHSLGFRPKMTIAQVGPRKGTRRGLNPSIRFHLHTRPGDANISSIGVILPQAFEIDQGHLGNICSRAQLASEACAGRQPIGTVVNRTPLLDQPLAGHAYAVSGFGGLPHVVFILEGQVKLMPEAESRTGMDGRLRTTVPIVPDAPIGNFQLQLFGGKQGYLQNTRSLCTRPVTSVEFNAQNGKSYKQRIPLKASCGKSKRSR